jgi:hypothetical protein
MIENYRTQFVWKTMRRNPLRRRGLTARGLHRRMARHAAQLAAGLAAALAAVLALAGAAPGGKTAPPCGSGDSAAKAKSCATWSPSSSSGTRASALIVQQIPWTSAHEKLLTAFVGRSHAGHCPARQHLDPGVRRHRRARPARRQRREVRVRIGGRYFRGSGRTRSTTARFTGSRGTWTRAFCTTGRTSSAASAMRRAADLERVAGRDAQGERIQPAGAHPYLLPTNEWEQLAILGLQKGSRFSRTTARAARFAARVPRGGRVLRRDLSRDLAPIVATRSSATRTRSSRAEHRDVDDGAVEPGRVSAAAPRREQDLWMTVPAAGARRDAVAGGLVSRAARASRSSEARGARRRRGR